MLNVLKILPQWTNFTSVRELLAASPQYMDGQGGLEAIKAGRSPPHLSRFESHDFGPNE